MIPKPVWREACGIAFGMYRMNATSSVAYAFNVSADGKEVGLGEFMFRNEDNSGFNGIVEFGEKISDSMLVDNTNGKTRTITKVFPEVRGK